MYGQYFNKNDLHISISYTLYAPDGQRQIGELQLSELITALLLSELAAAPTANPSIPLLHAILPITALISLEIIGTMLVTKIRFHPPNS